MDMDMLQRTCPQSGRTTTTVKELSTKWTDYQNGENILQVHKMDGALKGDITPTKWTDNHDDKRATHKVDGPPKRLKFLRVHEMDNHINGKPPQSGWIVYPSVHLNRRVQLEVG